MNETKENEITASVMFDVIRWLDVTITETSKNKKKQSRQQRFELETIRNRY